MDANRQITRRRQIRNERQRCTINPLPARIPEDPSAPSHLSPVTAVDLLGTSQLLISRVHPSNKTLLIGDLEQQIGKCIALLLGKNGK
jgi:hypothetical protein